MKKFFSACLLIASITCRGQKTVDVDKSDGLTSSMFFTVGGEPYVNVKFTRLVSGTPYFRDEWMKAMAISNGDVKYKPCFIKLNLLDDNIHFMGAAGEEMIANLLIKNLTLTDTLSGENFHFIHSDFFLTAPAVKKGWYLEKITGKASLYQFSSRQLQESKPYGSATMEQTIYTKEEFYIYWKQAFTQIKKAKEIPLLLDDKKQQLEDFLKNNKAANNSEEDKITALVSFYNSLQ